MENNLKIARENQDKLTIKAPISGQLTSLNREIGESISRGERIGQVDVLDGFKIRAGVDEHYIARINVGQKGRFDFDGSTYELEIMEVYPEVLNGKFNIDLTFVNETPTRIRRGQTIHMKLELGDAEKAVVIPTGGFFQKTGGQWIFVVNEDNKTATKRKIKLGRQNPKYYRITEGLQPGEKVIISSYDNFGDIEKLILK
jgi:HlyD family secretion protein